MRPTHYPKPCRPTTITANQKPQSTCEAGTRSSYFTTASTRCASRQGPGDYVFIPPDLPHREENPDPDTQAEVVIARSTQEAVVINLPALYPLRESGQ